jgi:hypothetical protein
LHFAGKCLRQLPPSDAGLKRSRNSQNPHSPGNHRLESGVIAFPRPAIIRADCRCSDPADFGEVIGRDHERIEGGRMPACAACRRR